MHKDIIHRSIQHMSSDANIIRITFLTSFFHSLVVTLVLILNTNKLFVNNYENGLYIWKIAEFLIGEINKNHVVSRVIWITIVLFLLYSFVYPIGQAAVIHYLHWQKSIFHSLKSVVKYFPNLFKLKMSLFILLRCYLNKSIKKLLWICAVLKRASILMSIPTPIKK